MRARTFILVMIAAFVLGLGVTEAKEQLFRLVQVSNITEAKLCAEQDGKAALLFNINEDGDLDAPFGSFCVTTVK